MLQRQRLLVVGALISSVTLGSSAAWAVEVALPGTVIVACDHGGQRELATKVSGLEMAGGVPERVAESIRAESSCARVFNRLTRAGFGLIHRLSALGGDFDGDGDVDGRDFLVWQRNTSPPPVSEGTSTVLLKCEYRVADEMATRLVGREIAGALGSSLGGLLTSGSPCAAAYALLGGAGFVMVSGASAPASGDADTTDLQVWRNNFGSGP